MGMAASQARLLSITARLNNIELQSQNISNAKLRLADSTDAASDKYVKALNKTHYLYNTYNASGDVVSTALTGAALTNYGELKNQYGLVNTAGQILVSERDAANFNNSNTLEEFLDKYGVLADISEGITIEYINPVWTDYQSNYEDQLAEWEAKKPNPNDPKYTIPGTTTVSDIYQKFLDSVEGCFKNAVNDNLCCYMHVLVDLIGTGTHTTSTGNTYETDSRGIHDFSWHTTFRDYPRTEEMDTVTELIKHQTCSGDVISGGTENVTTSYGTVTVGGPPSDPNMTIYQRAVDLLWEVHNEYDFANDPLKGGKAQPESLQKFFYFVEHDLKKVTETKESYDQDAYDADVAAWEAAKPVEDTTIEKYLPKTVRVATDLDEAQWYVNLWNRMNGVSNFKGGFGNSGAYDPDAGWASKSTTEQSWAVLKDGDMNSPEYLKYAIENGLITLEQVQFTEISSSEQGVKNAEWTSIVFTNAQDIIEVKDEVAISKAEVEYTKALKEIEVKDKQYDTDLKKLDTEHNALQTEYDSIKTVLQKNVERSFKTFNG